MKQALFVFLALLLIPVALHAEDITLEPVPDRSPTERSLLLGIGRTNQLDTYLSPMEYTGTADHAESLHSAFVLP